MKVPFLDLKAQYQQVGPELEAAVLEVLRDGRYCLGPAVKSFEQRFAEYCTAQYCVGVNSGTSALHLSLLAAGVGPGDEVIVPAMTFVATAAAVEYAGALPVFVDIEPDYYTMDSNKLAGALTAKTKAIIPVHLYGQCADMDPILAFAREHGLAVIEDAAQAHGAEYKGQRAGSMGDLACFSFYPGKNLGACGEAGAVVTDNEEFFGRLKAHRDWGQYEKGVHELQGFNYRMEGVQGAALGVKLNYIEQWTEGRRSAAQVYNEMLAADEALPVPPAVRADCRHVYHVYPILVKDRDRMRSELDARGISTGIHYPCAVHLQPAFASRGNVAGDFPYAERVADHEISLPMFPEISEAQVAKVVATLVSAFT